MTLSEAQAFFDRLDRIPTRRVCPVADVHIVERRSTPQTRDSTAEHRRAELRSLELQMLALDLASAA